MEKANVTLMDNPSLGDWIRDSLHPWELSFAADSHQIGIVIPSGFDRYVLVRHTGPRDIQGCLGDQTLKSLIDLLTPFTKTSNDCFFALWEGQGWMHSGSIGVLGVPEGRFIYGKNNRFLNNWRSWRHMRKISKKAYSTKQSLDHLESHSLPDGIMESGRLSLPNRNYLLMNGPITEASNLGYQFSNFPSMQSPNLMWPRDQAWVLASEIDFDVTLIGGSSDLVDAILQIPHLVTEEFNWSDSVAQLRVLDR